MNRRYRYRKRHKKTAASHTNKVKLATVIVELLIKLLGLLLIILKHKD